MRIFFIFTAPGLLINHSAPADGRPGSVPKSRETESGVPAPTPVPSVPSGDGPRRACSGGGLSMPYSLASPALPGTNAGIDKKVILNKKKATWLCWVQGCHRGLLPFAFVCGFLWYLHFQLTGSLGKLTVSPFSRRAAERKCFSLSSAWCFPFQLGQTAINTAHPVLHSNCCESLRP